MIEKVHSNTIRSKCMHCGAMRYSDKLDCFVIKRTHLKSKFYLCNYRAGSRYLHNSCREEYFSNLTNSLANNVIPELTILLQLICQLKDNNFKSIKS